MPYDNDKIDINKHEVDIETLKKQNVNDLLSIKELYRKIEKIGEKISQIKYIDSKLADKLKKDYEKLKRIILDENIQIKLTNNINEINSQLDNITNNPNLLLTRFGAKADGVTEDSQSIQRYIDFCVSRGQNIIVIPAGEYNTSYSILIPNNVTLIGKNVTLKIEDRYGSFTVFASKNVNTEEWYDNITIDGFTIDNFKNGEMNGIGLIRCKNSKIINCKTNNLRWHLTDIASCKNVIVEGCEASNCTNSAFQVDRQDSSGTVLGSVLVPDGMLIHGGEIEPSSHITFRNNRCINNVYSFHLHKEGVNNIIIDNNYIYDDDREVNHFAIYNDLNKNLHDITIKNNICEGARTFIAIFSNIDNIDIYNNNCKNGIWFIQCANATNSKNIRVYNNIITDIVLTFSLINLKNVIIKNNYLKDCAFDNGWIWENFISNKKYIVHLSNVSNLKFMNNYIENCDYHVFRINGAIENSNIFIEGNEFCNAYNLLNRQVGTVIQKNYTIKNNKFIGDNLQAYYPIRLKYFNDSEIEGNYITTFELYAIFLENCNNIKVLNNKIDNINESTSKLPVMILLKDSNNLKLYNNEILGSIRENYISFQGTTSNIEIKTKEIVNCAIANGVKIEYYANTKPNVTRFISESVCINTDYSNGAYKWVYDGTTWKTISLS